MALRVKRCRAGERVVYPTGEVARRPAFARRGAARAMQAVAALAAHGGIAAGERVPLGGIDVLQRLEHAQRRGHGGCDVYTSGFIDDSSAPMKIAVAQINTTVGDFAGNAERIRKSIEAARAAGAKLVVTPELALSGYPPEDLLFRDDFLDQCRDELMKLAAHCLDIAVIVGHPHREGRTRYNAASVLRGGRIEAMYFKQRLPNYQV